MNKLDNILWIIATAVSVVAIRIMFTSDLFSYRAVMAWWILILSACVSFLIAWKGMFFDDH